MNSNNYDNEDNEDEKNKKWNWLIVLILIIYILLGIGAVFKSVQCAQSNYGGSDFYKMVMIFLTFMVGPFWWIFYFFVNDNGTYCQPINQTTLYSPLSSNSSFNSSSIPSSPSSPSSLNSSISTISP